MVAWRSIDGGARSRAERPGWQNRRRARAARLAEPARRQRELPPNVRHMIFSEVLGAFAWGDGQEEQSSRTNHARLADFHLARKRLGGDSGPKVPAKRAERSSRDHRQAFRHPMPPMNPASALRCSPHEQIRHFLGRKGGPHASKGRSGGRAEHESTSAVGMGGPDGGAIRRFWPAKPRICSSREPRGAQGSAARVGAGTRSAARVNTRLTGRCGPPRATPPRATTSHHEPSRAGSGAGQRQIRSTLRGCAGKQSFDLVVSSPRDPLAPRRPRMCAPGAR
jgi:hypothetical protein